MLKCLIVPLLVSSITSAIGSLDLSMSKKIAFRAIIYYFTTTVCAVILGIILVSTIRPGAGREVSNLGGKATTRQVLTADTLLDLVRYVSEGGIGAPECLGQLVKCIFSFFAEIYSHRTSSRLQCSRYKAVWHCTHLSL